MTSQFIQHYDDPHRFEPLLPAEGVAGPLLERASDLTRAATALGTSTTSAAQLALRALLRSMNSYYTNRLEGEHSRPSDIERALHNDYSTNPDLARKQRLAVAHIKTEEVCETEIDDRLAGGEDAVRSLFQREALTRIHQQLFAGLPEKDLTLSDGSIMVPGELRTHQVSVGIHEAPLFSALPAFLDRWGSFYSGVRRGELAILAIAASHHRLAWVHPFPDGNGRAARLHTHLLFHAVGLTNGLWSPLRGFARSEDRYKALLRAADEHRRGDLDGRGNLTQAGLMEWMSYTLDICIDQVEFMTQMMDIRGMKDRIFASLTFDEATKKNGVRAEAVNALHYLFSSQAELGRAEFKAMSGLGERVATQTVSSLLREGYLASDSAYGKVRFAVPRHALRFYFPQLWPEAEQDEALIAKEQQAAPTAGVSARDGVR